MDSSHAEDEETPKNNTSLINDNDQATIGDNVLVSKNCDGEKDRITNESSIPLDDELGKEEKALTRPLKEKFQSPQEETKQVERAVRFLLHPSIAKLPHLMKESYLRSKDLAERDILRAKHICETPHGLLNQADSVWDSTDEKDKSDIELKSNEINNDSNNHHTSREKFLSDRSRGSSEPFVRGNQFQQGITSPMDMDSSPSPELPNPFVPLTIGGLLTIFGLATLRWLNGGEFILFPPPSVENPFVNDETVDQGDEAESLENETGMVVDPECVLEDEGTNFLIDEQQGCRASNNSILSCEVNNLTKAIEHHSLLQERMLKIDSEEKARNMTNNVMNLLRQDNSKPNESKMLIEDPSNNTCDLFVLMQLTELKCAINSIAQNVTKDNIFDDEKCNALQKTLEKTTTQLRSIESILLKSSDESDLNNERNANLESILAPVENLKELEAGSSDEIKMSVSKEGVKESDDTVFPTMNKEVVAQQEDIEEISKVGSQALVEALYKFKESNPKDKVESCAQMLYLYTSNLFSNPTLPRYKKVYTNNSTYKNKVGSVEYASSVLHAIGFVDQGSYLEWKGDELLKAQICSQNEDSTTDALIAKENAPVGLVKKAVDALNLLKEGINE